MANEKLILEQSRIDGQTLNIDLWYPGQEDNVDTFEIGLMCVRSAANIQVSYDFDRDGWVVKQAAWAPDDVSYNPDWREVAFIQAWPDEPTADPQPPHELHPKPAQGD